jgi:AbiV family abortive infection protein
MSKDRINNVKLEKLLEGGMKAVRNSQCLCDEAELLHNKKMFSRSYALSHFAREEFGKGFMLFRIAIEVAVGSKIDWKTLDRRFRDHKQKLVNDRAISLVLFGHIESNGKKINPLELFATIEHANMRKNQSLYVDWQKGEFVAPWEVISEHQSERNLSLAVYRIAKLSPILVEISQYIRSQPKKLFREKHSQTVRDVVEKSTVRDVVEKSDEIIIGLIKQFQENHNG